MAATRLIPMHLQKSRSIQDCKNRDDGTSICKTECRTFSWRAESAGARHSKEER